jgi:hypothetical protein
MITDFRVLHVDWVNGFSRRSLVENGYGVSAKRCLRENLFP